MHTASTWYGYAYAANSNMIEIGDITGTYFSVYYGYFSYGPYNSTMGTNEIYGTITGYQAIAYGVAYESVTGLNISAYAAEYYIQTNQLQSLYQLAFGGNDQFVIGTTGNYVIDGYGGYNTLSEPNNYASYTVWQAGSVVYVSNSVTQDNLYNIQEVDFSDGKYYAGTQRFVPTVVPQVTLGGAHTGFTMAPNGLGDLTITNIVTNATQSFSGDMAMVFTDGTGLSDPYGSAGEAARLYQAALGRAPDVSGLEYWTAQLDSGALSVTGEAAGFMISTEFTTKYGTSITNDAFVQQLYLNVLHRTADAGGENYWDTQLANGLSRASVLVDFSESFENASNTMSTIGDATLSETYRLYQAAFDRTPDTGGLSFWFGQMEQGIAAVNVAASFIASSEFATLYDVNGLPPDNTTFVADLYNNVLHRAPDSTGAAYWAGQLNSGVSRASVLLAFSDSAENRLNTAAATHDGWVFIAS